MHGYPMEHGFYMESFLEVAADMNIYSTCFSGSKSLERASLEDVNQAEWVDGSKAALYTPGMPPAGCRNHRRELISVERAEEMEDS